jgi:hypothetical protein
MYRRERLAHAINHSSIAAKEKSIPSCHCFIANDGSTATSLLWRADVAALQLETRI